MSTADLLRVIALVSAWVRADAEAATILIHESRPDLVAHLIEFTLMILNQNTEGNATAFLEWMGDQARTLHAHEAKQLDAFGRKWTPMNCVREG